MNAEDESQRGDGVEALSNKMKQLKELIASVVGNVERRAESCGMEKSELWKDVQEADGWQK